eukprot:CAMPEP_0198217816 /NCGR_PEP_ID=MMETSP1445-20131203/65970_1 /TAXON_ID=36898 /ORGANISM="Pyramimonas sp., Strain CCMP2087" /LENGTH=132 /DNA_ID=CAMNT_0043894633 /DNA_START=151 /DNA_END=546 /DNA_ORIENTATION=-
MKVEDNTSRALAYSALVNDPKRNEVHEKRNAEVAHEIERIRATMPRRDPKWTEERRLSIDKLALHHGKRMVLWDDAGMGFYLWINWDWSANCPAQQPTNGSNDEAGWYSNYKQMLKAPLLDTTLADEQLAEW